MIKAFLVEDETVIREGLRDKIPWEQYGYEFVGEAADGEMALPLIRKFRPDVLITDIKMPFMDGLSLSRIVHEEFPDIKIIIISGYDDFEYARQAIEVGVEQYLLKPITRSKLTKVLSELKEKIEQTQEQQDYQKKYQTEIHEYEQFSRRHFFEKVLEGELSVSEIYEEASKLELNMSAASYNLLILYLQDREEEALHFFLRNPQYIVVRLNVSSIGILVMADEGQIELMTNRGIDYLKKTCGMDEKTWYLAVGKPVERLSMLAECYQQVVRIYAARFLLPNQHILDEGILSKFEEREQDNSIDQVESAKMNPEIIREFLHRGSQSEIENFVDGYIQSVRDALESKMFRDYVVLNIRFTVIAYVEGLGISQEEFLQNLGVDMGTGSQEIAPYFVSALRAALEIRDKQSDDQTGRIMRQAMDYIDEHFTSETLSLNEVATQVSVSANYLSAVFSQNMQVTFIEYVTKKRMEKAKKLLRSTDTLASEIARQVGYKDSHYFSFVFKKTQGCSPREYRSGKKG